MKNEIEEILQRKDEKRKRKYRRKWRKQEKEEETIKKIMTDEACGSDNITPFRQSGRNDYRQ